MKNNIPSHHFMLMIILIFEMEDNSCDIRAFNQNCEN